MRGLQQEVDIVEATMEQKAETIERLKKEVNDTHQYSRRCNLELHGLPLVHGEDFMQVMNDVSQSKNTSVFKYPDNSPPRKKKKKKIALMFY